MSLEDPILNRPKPKTRDQDLGAHLIGNVYELVRLKNSFPHIFDHINLSNHSSVLIFDPQNSKAKSKNIDRLYECLDLHPNRSLLFSQEGMSICTISSYTEEQDIDIRYPLVLREVFSKIHSKRRCRESKKENITAIYGQSRINITNFSDIKWYCNNINPDFEYILYCAFEDIEEFCIKEDPTDNLPIAIEQPQDNATASC